MNVLPETDKQVGAILEAIREVSPQVVEQAVVYHRVANTMWLAVMFLTVGVLIGVWRWGAKQWDESDGHQMCAVFSAGFACLLFVVCINVGLDLAATYFAPDYYAAECMIELARSALGK